MTAAAASFRGGQSLIWTVRSGLASVDLAATYVRRCRNEKVCIVDLGFEAARRGMPRLHRVPVKALRSTSPSAETRRSHA